MASLTIATNSANAVSSTITAEPTSVAQLRAVLEDPPIRPSISYNDAILSTGNFPNDIFKPIFFNVVARLVPQKPSCTFLCYAIRMEEYVKYGERPDTITIVSEHLNLPSIERTYLCDISYIVPL